MYEIQLHPADIRKQVRYYFLSRKGFRRLVALGVVLALVLVAGIVLAPLGIQSLLLTGKLHSLSQQHALQHEILDQRIMTLDRLDREVAQARALQQQMSLILGSPQGSEGPGGYPEPNPGDLLLPETQIAVRRGLKLDSDTKALLTLADELASFARSNADLSLAVPSICPLPIGSFVLTSPFGNRTSPFTNTVDFHSGIDLAAREGTPVLASGGGRVVFAGRYPLRRNVRWWRYGNVVVAAHGDRYLTIYAHLHEISVRRGATLRRGEELGTVGNTGWSTSPHLHYEVRVRTEGDEEPVPVDPRIYILNYQWTGHEELLIQARTAPPPAFDPLPSRMRGR
ncbi:MAG: M23 family metallopeptidase [Acidobacteria bacterium]|jgi:murein DD-endopeptidase MepM/ murein hydrolase activator NlpD|nr:M23 family metallopeptidase [Acidobacteriota bacterium]